MPAADGVDARARRVAARLLSSRARRAAPGAPRPGDVPPLDRTHPSPRHLVGGHPAGSARIAKALKGLESDGWVILAQARRPGATAGERLDHLAVGPGGVVLVDSRSWVGRIEVNRGIVQQNGFWREQETAAIARSAGCVAALLLPRHRTAVHAFVCVAQHDLVEHVVAPGVHVVGASGIARALRALPYRLHPAEVQHLVALLRRNLVDAEPPDQLTTAALEGGSWAGGGPPPGAHREPGVLPFVPVAATPRPARSMARRQRPPRPWWRTPRVAVPRALLAVLVLAAVLLAGPGVASSLLDTVDGTPAPAVLPSVAPIPTVGPVPATPRGRASPEPTRRVLAPVWSGTAPIRPAATAPEQQPPESLTPGAAPRPGAASPTGVAG